jgi:hypothetical protein
LYYNHFQSENAAELILREEIKKQNWELQKELLKQEARVVSQFWNDSQFMNRTILMEKYNISAWTSPLEFDIVISYEYETGLIANYEANHPVIVHYPIELISSTETIPIDKVRSCSCPLNQAQCNSINNTDFVWQLHTCTGLPVTYRISVFSTNMTKNYPHYLFGGECRLTC